MQGASAGAVRKHLDQVQVQVWAVRKHLDQVQVRVWAVHKRLDQVIETYSQLHDGLHSALTGAHMMYSIIISV